MTILHVLSVESYYDNCCACEDLDPFPGFHCYCREVDIDMCLLYSDILSIIIVTLRFREWLWIFNFLIMRWTHRYRVYWHAIYRLSGFVQNPLLFMITVNYGFAASCTDWKSFCYPNMKALRDDLSINFDNSEVTLVMITLIETTVHTPDNISYEI